jgi:periplasmic divalent cation tolerance protein
MQLFLQIRHWLPARILYHSIIKIATEKISRIYFRVKAANAFCLALVTAPDLKMARALAEIALRAKLIACANLVPKIESHYRWRGKIESGAEVLLILKTRQSKLPALEKLIVKNHPYDTPEFLVLPLRAGNKKYLDWLAGSVS